MQPLLFVLVLLIGGGEAFYSATILHISKQPFLNIKGRSNSHYNIHLDKSTVRYNRINFHHQEENVQHQKNSKLKTALSILNAALLVSGTTIGGGFLALPAVVSPSGFFPSSITLIGVWLFFLAQSFVLVECITRAKQIDTDNSNNQDQSITATAKSIFGFRGEVLSGTLLTLVIQATLVSQISRAGIMFSNYKFGCIISALSIAMVVFGPKSGIIFASRANAMLTSLFLFSCMTVFGFGVQIADWSRLTLSNWSLVTPAIPTFLQLLVYGEIIPSICQILKYNSKHTHAAIFIGSFLTLFLQIGWSGLGLSCLRLIWIQSMSYFQRPTQYRFLCFAWHLQPS